MLNSPGASPHLSKGLGRLLEEQETPADNVCHPPAVQSDVQGWQNWLPGNSRTHVLYHRKNLTSCSSKQPGVPCSFMSINYIKQSKSHHCVVCGSSKLPPSVSLSEGKGGLLSCSHSSRSRRCFYTYQDKVGNAQHSQQVWDTEPWTCWEVDLRGRKSEKLKGGQLDLLQSVKICILNLFCAM